MLKKDGHAPADSDPRRGSAGLKPRVEWLGQTGASLAWICSVLVYGLESTGDWLQLCAASSWFVANMAALIPVEEGRKRLMPRAFARSHAVDPSAEVTPPTGS